jgi:dihydroneopterin aldolase
MRGLELDAQIGVYPHERGRAQPLVIDVEVALSPRQVLHLADTLNYETLAGAARRLAREHIELVETYAQRLTAICLEDERVVWARVRVEKPGALPGARAAGVEIITRRDET